MSRFRRIFDVFSRRPESSEKLAHDIPETTRTRVLLWCNEIFGDYIQLDNTSLEDIELSPDC